MKHASSEYVDSVSSRPIPAWMLSLVVHLVLLVLLVLLVQPAVPQGLGEPDRPAGIVLAQSTSAQQFDYFQETEPTEEQADARQPSAANAVAAIAPLETLPASPSAMPFPDIQLPGVEQPQRRGDALIVAANVGDKRGGRPVLADGSDHSLIVAAEQAARRARGPGGPATEVSMFGSAGAVGNDFVFVIDRSHSMGETGLGVLTGAKGELGAALARLEPHHRFQVVAYNQKPTHFEQRNLKPATPENRQRAVQFVGGLPSIGGTEHDRALMTALALQPDVIFLLTDGGFPHPNTAAMRTILRRAGRRTHIHCIRFGSGPDQESDHFMQQLARETGGDYHYVDMRRP